MSKTEKFLFYLFVFCLPFQTRWILYQWGSNFNEWISVYLYFTDILLISILLFWFWRKKNSKYLKERLHLLIEKPSFWLIIFLIVSSISIIKAGNIQLGFYNLFKLLEFICLFFYVKYSFNFHLLKRTAQIFVISSLFQSLIAIKQYLSQASLGLKYLAESPLSVNIAGVAKIVVKGVKIIRPYGSFPHPNILASYLLVSIFFVYFLWLRKEHSKVSHYFFFITFFFLFFSLLLSFSRVIIFSFILASLFFFFSILWKVVQTIDLDLFKRILLVFFIFLILCSFFLFAAWPEISSRFKVSSDEQAVYLRDFYNETALFFIQESPWLGIGIGNSVSETRNILNLLQSWLHQPVHNIYLLISAELGLIGLIFFLLFIYKLTEQLIKRKQHLLIKYSLFFILFSFLFIGFFDHFFLTLQQGQLLFWLALGIISVDNLKNISEEV